MPESRVVSTAEQLQAAVADGVEAIEVRGTIKGAPSVVLAPGTSLRGGRLDRPRGFGVEAMQGGLTVWNRGIGFVNFSDIQTLIVQAPIQTYGNGARGFNL